MALSNGSCRATPSLTPPCPPACRREIDTVLIGFKLADCLSERCRCNIILLLAEAGQRGNLHRRNLRLKVGSLQKRASAE
jgi:hypothetical protein